ncbi:MAG: 2Fe-2S iron-sulfur cluster binding domain-containing protein, partial [Actinobacteria bacterium]|nr:2Fe-2S iron-sulfur cluster binding domain-containing protein [Actinomycetota bacterium]
MQIKLFADNALKLVDVKEGQSVLDVLQEQQLAFPAPCGGAGTCGKCLVLIKDSTGLGYKKACQTDVEEGMEIIVEKKGAIEVKEEGLTSSFTFDDPLPGAYGVAIDVGTTTIVCHLHELTTGKRLASASRANPQVVFGGDVISRITAS